ncbi:hypothetical protein BDZ97DRAFT_1761982 [Flammula alnicola]|nr:hypothetical protein BDZ97DRAFT_1761982 [Flammula alnicola]
MRILLAYIHLPPSALLFMLFLDIAHLPKSRKHHFTGCMTRTRGLGANSANIIVQSRIMGQLQEEKMQVYVRLGIRLLYKGATSRMEGARGYIFTLVDVFSSTSPQGVKYDDTESAKEIPTFVEFHGLNVDEILDPLDSFKTFNEFFYRLASSSMISVLI